MQCVQKQSPFTDYDITGVKDSPQRTQCHQNMVNDINSSNQCICLKGFCLNGNSCQQCPSYCLYCSSLSGCSFDRDANGKCLNPNYFDDGQNCIQPLLTIPNTNNLRYTFSKPKIGNACGTAGVETDPTKFIFTQFQLNMSPSDYSIFFSFGIIISVFNQGFNQIKIAKVYKNNQEILNVFLEAEVDSATGNIFFSIVFALSNILQKKFQFFTYDTAWIAYWSDNKNHIFMVNSNRVNGYEEYQNNQLFYDNQIQICVGRCDIQFDTTLNCFQLQQIPFTFIKNIPYPTTSGIKYLFRFMAKDVNLLAKYSFDLNQANFRNQIKNKNGILPSADLAFFSALQFYNSIQGFGLSQSNYGYVNFLSGNTFGLLTMSFNIEFSGQIQEQLIQFYQMIFFSKVSIVFYFEFDYTLNIFRIVACFIEGCKSTRLAILYLNQSNFVLINPQNYRTLQAVLFLEYFQIDIVCNQVKETLFFEGQFQTEGLQNIQLALPGQQTLMYFDNFSIFDAYGFIYYDYTQLNPCYIYMNAQHMNCIRLKNGYLYYQDTIITQKQCLQLSISTNQIFVINFKNQTCDQVLIPSQDDILCAVGEYVNGTFICKICRDQNADPTKKCLKCLSSYFLNDTLKKCQKCSAICKECQYNMNNCTDCYFPDQGPPSCNCLLEGQYLDSNFKCNQCSYKCKSCINSQFQCLTCSSPSRVLPTCECNAIYKEVNFECVLLTCEKQCLTCTNATNNCQQCEANRINPPKCQCIQGYVEGPDGNCQRCPSNTYYDSFTQKCQNCQQFCISCTENKCKQCMSGLKQDGQNCQCPSNLEPFISNDKQILCLDGLDLSIKVQFSQNQYIIQLIFIKDLKGTDFSISSLNDILQLYIPNVDQQFYSLTSPSISKNVFKVYLNVKKDFSAQQAYIIIKNNQYFQSSDQKSILKQSYINQMLGFQIGPLVLQLKSLENQSIDYLNNQINSFKDSNASLFNFINQIQIVFYLLNTLQPIAGFLLLNIVVPPDLYKFYQIIGMFIFPFVPDYQSTVYKSQFYFFNYLLDAQDSQQPNYGNFYKFGYVLSLIVNIPILLIKQLALLAFLWIIQTFILLLKDFKKQNIIIKIKIFLIQRINSDNEINLLNVVVCIFIQLSQIEQESYFYRIGFYIAILQIIFQLKLFHFNLRNVINNSEENNEYSKLYTERIQNKKSLLMRSYFIIQIIKKYFYLAFILFLHKYPILVCILNGNLIFLSAISIFYFKPYTNIMSRYIKFLGDIIFSCVWYLHIWIIFLLQKILKNSQIEKQYLEEYFIVGKVILILLVIVNCLFILQILADIFLFIQNIYQTHFQKKKPIIFKINQKTIFQLQKRLKFQ
ncbi:hypothetical protein ABPG72_012945 [Tetrahymena utriculariae]